TILVTDGIAFTANPSLYGKVPYDATRDFDPVAAPATTMQILAVNPSIAARSIQELVALIKANPGKYSYASAGVGTGAHLTGELFRISLGLVALLHDEIARAAALPDVEARLVGLGFEPFTATPDEVAALIKRELPKWAGVIRAAGIKPN